MNRPFAFKIVSTDAAFVASLDRSTIDVQSTDGESRDLELQKGSAMHVPGAMLGWWEIAVGVGLTAAPLSVLSNVLASWISGALGGEAPRGETKIILRSADGRVSDVTVSSADRATVTAAIHAALLHVDRAE